MYGCSIGELPLAGLVSWRETDPQSNFPHARFAQDAKCAKMESLSRPKGSSHHPFLCDFVFFVAIPETSSRRRGEAEARSYSGALQGEGLGVSVLLP